jgi:hypothetical protein
LSSEFKEMAMAETKKERTRLKRKLEEKLGGELRNLPEVAKALRNELLNKGYVF